MGNLFTSLLSTSNSLGVYSKALQIVSDNVTNASTPGYVKQTPQFQALPVDFAVGLPGGVGLDSIGNARDAYAENNVRERQSELGFYRRQASSLAPVENVFDLSGASGTGAALNGLFQTFSQLSVSPNDPLARQNVLTQSAKLAQTFQQADARLQDAAGQTVGAAGATVAEVNRLAGSLAQLNTERTNSPQGSSNPGLDAQLNSTLEELSKYVNYSALQQPDGTVSVYAGGQTPLVLGGRALPLQGDFSQPQARILDSQGKDITGQISQGELAGLVDVQNRRLPAYRAGLNTLAQAVADQVNTALSKGIDANGTAPANALFTYDANVGAAASLAVNPAFTPDQVAAALPGAPGGNGNALNLAALATAKTVNGSTFAGFYGGLAGGAGQDIASANAGQDNATQILTQAQAVRSQVSGVSLDEEAERLIQFQRAYQATAKLFGVLNDLTGTTIDMLHV